MDGNQEYHKMDGRIIVCMSNRAYHEDIKCPPYEVMFGVHMKLGIASSVGPQNSTNNVDHC